MRSSLKFLVPALAASLALAACGSSSSKSGSSSLVTTTASSGESTTSRGESAAVVKAASNATLGATVLVDAQGMTLYHLGGEQGGKFICTTSACLGVWHPLSASSAATPSGSVGSLGTVKRPDGTEQVTYQGTPLYTFAQDKSPGQAGGQGIKDVGTWTAVRVSSTGSSAPAPATTPAPATSPAPATAPATTSTATPPPPASSGGGGGGYGY
jgi:predicted lipoprotein with Yx(FWY)xxD motif